MLGNGFTGKSVGQTSRSGSQKKKTKKEKQILTTNSSVPSCLLLDQIGVTGLKCPPPSDRFTQNQWT